MVTENMTKILPIYGAMIGILVSMFSAEPLARFGFGILSIAILSISVYYIRKEQSHAKAVSKDDWSEKVLDQWDKIGSPYP